MRATAQELNDAAKYGPYCELFFLVRLETDPTPVPTRHGSTKSLFFLRPAVDSQHSASDDQLSRQWLSSGGPNGPGAGSACSPRAGVCTRQDFFSTTDSHVGLTWCPEGVSHHFGPPHLIDLVRVQRSVFEEDEAVIQTIMNSVDLDWLFERISLDSNTFIRCVDTKEPISDIVTEVHFIFLSRMIECDGNRLRTSK